MKIKKASFCLGILSSLFLLGLLVLHACSPVAVPARPLYLTYDEYDSRDDRQVVNDDYQRAIIDSTDDEGGFVPDMKEFERDSEYDDDPRFDDDQYDESESQDDYFTEMYNVQVE